MRILFLGDIVGPSGCNVVKRFLPDIIKKRDLDFVVANGENAADSGLGITEKISKELFQLWNKRFNYRKPCLGSKRNS